jgi:tetratricopeptide (TPR) repeat protein
MTRLGNHPAHGERVGPYLLEETIGAGGMATVYLASATKDAGEVQAGSVVAVKILNPARVLPVEVKRFTREFQALKRMNHPNVVQVHGAGVEKGYPWIAMEYVDGSELGALIKRWNLTRPKDRFEKIEQLLRGLCDGLEYVHALGLIHRDIKPSNVLVSRDGRAKLTDFGVVKDPDSSGTQLTMAGRLVGTVAFMAPELIAAEEVDRRADLYALGAVLYLMLTFKRPIEASSVAGYLARHLTEIPTPPSQIDTTIPQRLERICQRLLLKDQAHRYPTARAVLQALDRQDGEEELPLRGRDELVNRWAERLANLHDGAGGCVLLHGRRQSGRSHLLKAFVEHGRNHGIRVVTAYGSNDYFGQLARSAGVELSAQRPLEVIIEKMKDQPCIIAVDDLDRAPGPVVEALARMVRDEVTLEGQPLLLLYTASDLEDVIAPITGGSATGIPTECAEVGPLDVKSVIAMMRDRGLVGSVSPVLGRRLHAEYGGLPGGIAQQLVALVYDGWFEQLPDTLRAVRPLADFRHAELPVPAGVQEEIDVRLAELDDEAAEVLELLAVLGRPSTSALLERCSTNRHVARLIDRLVRSNLLRRTEREHQEVLQFSHPCAARVIRNRLPKPRRVMRHRALADGLEGLRRRSASLEIATHSMKSGDLLRAYPLFIRAARRAAREGRYGEVLEICGRAQAIRQRCDADLDVNRAAYLRRMLYMLLGEALLARRSWDKAVEPLEQAVAAARIEEDQSALSRCLGSLGRAHYRRGRFESAGPLLSEALRLADTGAPERAPATRALADIRLRDGKLDRAEELWLEALDIAINMCSIDGEARARRGLAHLRGMQNRLPEAIELLDQTEDLLNPNGDDRVLAGVFARAVELDIVAGRYGRALHRAEMLLGLCRRREMPERLPEAHALHAEILLAIGERVAARDALHQSMIFSRAQSGHSWLARIRAARALANLEVWDQVEGALPTAEDLPDTMIDDPPGQVAAVRARLFANTNAENALDLATWVLARPKPMLAFRGAWAVLDVGKAFIAIGETERARQACKRGLTLLQGPGADGLRLELLVTLHHAGPDPRVLDAIAQIAQRILKGLQPQAAKSFSNRPLVEAALARI